MFYKTALFFFLVQRAVTWNSPACGISKYADAGQGVSAFKAQQRIINGIEARPNEFPWMVYLESQTRLRPSGQKAAAGAIIISKKYLLTAAHVVFAETDPANWLAWVGRHYTDDRADGKAYKIDKVVMHPDVVWTNASGLHNDITLLRLKGSLDFNENIKPVCSPNTETTYEGKPLIDMGWGTDENGVVPTRVLKFINAVGVTNNECSEFYKNYHWNITDSNICLKASPANTACYGDSGGPLVYNNNGSFELVGINSWATSCQDTVQVTTRVSAFSDLCWID